MRLTGLWLMLDLLLALSEEERLESVWHVNEWLDFCLRIAVNAWVPRERHAILRRINAEVRVLATLATLEVWRGAICHGGGLLVVLWVRSGTYLSGAFILKVCVCLARLARRLLG